MTSTLMPTTRDVCGIGVSVPRFDAPEKVTGRTLYVGDVKLPGLLQARLLRSPHAHARIKSIDVSKAKALQGVRAILTAADIPELKPSAKTRAHALLAIDRVVFYGQPVAADPLAAMDPSAPQVADRGTEADTSEARAHSGIAVSGTVTATRAPNIAQQGRLTRGDVVAAMAE